MNINQNYQNLQESYLFSTIAHKVTEYQKENPEADIIRLGIGDVTLPLAPAVIDALHSAADEMSRQESFRGYGPEQGYDFLRQAVQGYYASRSINLDMEDIFISDGAKSDLGNILDLFDKENTVLIPDPVYPVYVDTNAMAGRKVLFAAANEENGFLPLPAPAVKADIIYLCSPNNPTGAVYGREALTQWVDYANANDAVILFDAAYECFITEPILPRSIFEIPGAETCAIEFCSFSKMAGFTGMRCGWTVIPSALERQGMSLRKMWLRRQTTKFNGVPYVVQRAAAAVFTAEAQQQIHTALQYYQQNARVLSELLDELGIWYTGGKNSPYLWLKCPGGMDSWKFFDYLLEKAHVVGTPGEGFGQNGKNFFRLTAFGDQERTVEAAQRMRRLLCTSAQARTLE